MLLLFVATEKVRKEVYNPYFLKPMMIFYAFFGVLFLLTTFWFLFQLYSMSFRDHLITLSLLRDGEKVLHNCSSHWLIHMKNPLLYLISLLIPFLGVFAIVSGNILADEHTISLFWFVYALFGLVMTTYFFVRSINFELGACVITDQRVLRFGYRGLSEMIEREILPQKIEDVKIVRKGMMSLLFDSADVLIHTSNNEVETLKNIIDSRKIQSVFSQILSQNIKKSDDPITPSNVDHSEWIDDALGTSKGESFDVDEHRDDTIGQIGDVFRNKSD